MPDSSAQPGQALLVDITSGRLVASYPSGAHSESLEDFCAVSPELFSRMNVSWDSLFAALNRSPDDTEFKDLVLVGLEHIFVAQRLDACPSRALLSIAPRARGVGLALSEARQLARLLSERAAQGDLTMSPDGAGQLDGDLQSELRLGGARSGKDDWGPPSELARSGELGQQNEAGKQSEVARPGATRTSGERAP